MQTPSPLQRPSRRPSPRDQTTDARDRFGSWCYSGTVQLTPALALVDIPHVIPALRMQQSKLDFMCDVSQVSQKRRLGARFMVEVGVPPGLPRSSRSITEFRTFL